MNPAASALLTDFYQLNVLQGLPGAWRDQDGGVRVLRAQASAFSWRRDLSRCSGGRRLTPQPTLADSRARAAHSLERLPQPLRRLEPGKSAPVEVADALKQLAAEVDH